MGPPPGALLPMRMTASWSGSKQTDRIQVCGAKRCAPMASSPRIITQTYNGRHQTREVRRKAHLLSIVPPRAQGSRRCETQASLRRQAAKAPLAFRSLDPFRALREPDCRRRDEKRPFPLRTKNFSTTQNNRLTGKAPYKSANSRSLTKAHADRSRAGPPASRQRGGTESSNLLCSSAESSANRTS
jgi:hypothetical protein